MAATLSFSPFPLDHAGSTRMLKDFLHETNGNAKPKTTSFKSLAIHAVVAAVKRISFPSLKSPRILPRSFSRRLLGKAERDEREIGGDFVVKVKDIIRWRSFRDLVDETAAAPPLDFVNSPGRYTAAGTTTTTTTTTTATSSTSSSWCESDFTAEDLLSPSWRGCSDDGCDGEVGKSYFPCVGEDSTETTAAHEENDKKVNNALSRRDNKAGEEQKVLEEGAGRLLEHVDEAILLLESCRVEDRCRSDWRLLELFQRELINSRDNDEPNEIQVKSSEKMRRVKEDENGYEWFLSQKGKESYLREMEGKWGVFGVEEKVELGLEIEGEILGCLVDDILLDIFQL